MAQIKFYRGASGVSLPEHQDGAVFIVARNELENGGDMYTGDMYVDVSDGQRLHIKPNDAIYYKTAQEWASDPDYNGTNNKLSVLGKIYGISDYEEYTWTDNNQQIHTALIPGFQVGDGVAYAIDLPILKIGITEIEKDFWNKKVIAYAIDNNEELVLSALGKYPTGTVIRR